jgi:pilus assembly protein Flp/PilA
MASGVRETHAFPNQKEYRPPALAGDASLMLHTVRRFLKDETAATAIEYGLIAAGIAVAIISVVSGLGTKLKTTFSSVQTALK